MEIYDFFSYLTYLYRMYEFFLAIANFKVKMLATDDCIWELQTAIEMYSMEAETKGTPISWHKQTPLEKQTCKISWKCFG